MLQMFLVVLLFCFVFYFIVKNYIHRLIHLLLFYHYLLLLPQASRTTARPNLIKTFRKNKKATMHDGKNVHPHSYITSIGTDISL